MSKRVLKELKNDEKGVVFVGVIMIFLIAGIIGLTTMIRSSGESSLVQDNVEHTQAFYTAEAAINGIALQLTTVSNWNSAAWAGVSALNTTGGTAQLDSIVFSDADQTVMVTVTGTKNGEQRQIGVTYFQNSLLGSANVPAAASIKAASPMVNGNLQVDGRNHDRDCNLINNASGTYAMALESSAADFNFTGSADLGATSGGADWGMAHTTTDRVLFDVPDLPNNPDEVFGLSNGGLKSRAQSGGHYYDFTGGVDNSAFTVYDGVNYVELACGGAIWQPSSINMDNASSNAILVIHAVGADPDNPCSDSVYKAVGGGFFRGVLIMDHIDKLHGAVIGAVVGVGSGNSGGNLGNGSGVVCYSSQVLDDAVSAGGGGGPGSVNAVSWQENAL